ncbi:uncharacterized protein PpBr36_05676 [Pyricularia pennisetigena]|uniref:uncharacterized protein n=1 Tax=Pyricularia pennisetigena TaxID=1578925 RepID=UPI00114F08BB|nr:uncharacterized protein PpBr36_05676 [Pyricularia pennisetigena]TLS22879.1 hypothetical protein PpBr36_05676 [Pyricularia pennisetigena]
MSRDADVQAHSTAHGSKEKETLAPEDGGSARKGRGLLNVPSRSSSQRMQPSSTSTGLGGAAAGESRDSVDGHSKESKGSQFGRRRRGSASSNHSGVANSQTNTPANSQPSSPSPQSQKRKKGGLLSLFGCCGVPDSANALENGDHPLPNHKVDKIPNRPATASRRTATPSDQATPTKTLYEKEQTQPTQSTSDSSRTKRVSASTTNQDQSTVGERESESKQQPLVGSGGPVVTVQPPQVPGIPESSAQQPLPPSKDRDGDVEMQDEGASQGAVAQQSVEAPEQKLPPPPPGPIPGSNAAEDPVPSPDNALIPAAVPEPPEQKYLLPPIQPRFKGKKCLVLDLDETLVHSSFKILHQADFTIPVEIEGNYHNVYVIKRPGVDQFMKRVGELYEVVVFTASVSKYGDPLLDQLDIHNVVHHRLFRESCYNHQGNYVKDLSQVGRDLKDTIIIDNSPTSYIFHPQHAVPISSWFSDAHDNELLDLIPVLEDLAGSNVQDLLERVRRTRRGRAEGTEKPGVGGVPRGLCFRAASEQSWWPTLCARLRFHFTSIQVG